MIYLHVTIEVNRGKMKEWTKIYEEHLLPAMKKHGQRLVGAWRTSVGTYDEVTDLYAFENFAEFERIREGLFNDPVVQKYLPIINEISGREYSKIMMPFEYSEMK
ncbi:MAG: NIPSNAP family protein [Desulfatiglandales bacterium]